MKNKLINMIIFLGFFSISAIGIIAYQSISKIDFITNEYENILENENEKVKLSKNIEIILLKMHRAENNLIVENSFITKDVHKINFYSYKTQLDEDIIKLKNLIKLQQQEIKDFESNYDKYIHYFEEVMKLTYSSNTQQAMFISSGVSRDSLDKAMEDLSKIILYNEKSMEKSVTSAKENYYTLVLFIKTIVVVLLIILFVFIIYIYKFMTLRLKRIDNFISIIKNREFINNIELIPTIENDELSLIERSLYDAMILLQENEIAQNQQDWVKNSIIELSTILYEKETLSEILNISISTICRKINAGKGVIYLYECKKDKLKLSSSFACDNITSSEFIDLGEGVIGQVAIEKEALLLTNLHEKVNNIKTGIITAVPLNTYTYPLIYKDELIGVIELASSNVFSETQIEYLNGFIETLSAIIYASQLSNETKELLSLTQEQSLILQNSQQKLELQNEELEEQKQQLLEQTKNLELNQQELEQQNIEVNQIKEEIEKRSFELEESNKYKSEFLANMSHELRTPLNSINILSKILSENKNDNLTDKQVEQANVIYNSGKDLLQLINDILDLSKIEAGMMSISLENVNLKSLCIELFNMFNPIAKEKHLNLEFKLNEEIKTNIYTDKQKIKQIIKNFLSNALKFTSSNGNITILLDSNIETNDNLPIKISIVDTGIGIQKEKLETIFEAFQQVDGSTSRKYGGTGLGLSISKELAKILNAEITVQSIAGEGSIFSLLLPNAINTLDINQDLIDIVHADNKNNQSLITKQLLLSFPEDDRNNIKEKDKILLIIEDDINFANIVKDEAKKFNLKTIVTADGKEGLYLAEKYQPSGIILDINLPILSGWDVLKSLKSDIKTRHIPVKIISGDMPNVEAKKMGAVNFIQKPIELETLEIAIQKLVSKDTKEKDLLIVEDNDILRENLIEILDSDDVKIMAVSTGTEAIDAVKIKIFDCAIIDIGLPDMTGFKLLKTIKKLNCTLPVIVYSGRDFTKEELKVLREFSESIVIKTVESEARLIDETSLFLHRLHKNFTFNQKQILNNFLEYDDIFINKNVLIVDDDIRNIFALDSLLSNKGFIITSVYNGQEALLEIEKNEFDIILMDIMMPIMNGYETIENIRNDSRFKDIPIIALTAKAQKEDRLKCLDVGANDYITKPINEEQLLQLMKIWIKNI